MQETWVPFQEEVVHQYLPSNREQFRSSTFEFASWCMTLNAGCGVWECWLAQGQPQKGNTLILGAPLVPIHRPLAELLLVLLPEVLCTHWGVVVVVKQ